MNKNTGITIIAGVITIIVMLILSGITFSFVRRSNGILSRAQSVAETVRGSQVREYVESASAENMGYDGLEMDEKTKDEVIAELRKSGYLKENEAKLLEKQDKITIGGIEIDFSDLPHGKVLKAGEYASETTKYSDGTNSALIPAEFTVSGMKDEQNISSGLVIYRGDLSNADWSTGKDASGNDIKRTYNQYVWIPCTEDEYKRSEWEQESDNSTIATKDETTLSGVTLSNVDITNGITYDILNEIMNQIKIEKASVKKYGGFYIGRYEVGEGNVIMQYKNPMTNIMWFKAYQNAKKIDVGTTGTSFLCSSYSMDTAINFIQNNSEFKTYASTRDDGINGTAINENWKDKSVTYIDANGKQQTKAAGKAMKLPAGVTTPKCNIYDLAGNTSEFTTELNPLPNDADATVILHGSNYNHYKPAGYRGDSVANNVRDYFGFRATLFFQ